MKKLITRLSVALVALLALLAIATTAFAAGTGKITIADAGTETYEAYKIFDATDTNGDITYTIASGSEWLSKVYNTETKQSKIEGLEFIADNADNPTKYTVTKTLGFDAAKFAETLKTGGLPTGVTTINFTTDSANNTASTQATLDPGYYLVLSKASGATTYQERGMLTTVLNLAANETVTIQNKNDMPLDKTYVVNSENQPQREGDVQVGDVLTFTITGKVPDTTEYTSYAYVLTDTMTEGLTFNKDVVVKIDETEVTGINLITDENTLVSGSSILYYAAGNGFKLSLDLLERGKDTDSSDEVNNSQAGKTITVSYTATVNDAAACKVSENEAVLKYSNNPNDSTSFAVKDTETTSYTSRILVDKFETGAEEQKLGGAKFVLRDTKEATASSKYYYYNETTHKVEWVQAASADVPTSGITEVTTKTDGSAKFDGLADGTYYLVETAAPAGYAMLTEPIKIDVDGSAATTVGITPDQVAIALTKIANVSNSPSSLLPSTGGMGTTLFYVASAAVLAVIIVRFIRKDKSVAAA